MTPKGFSKAFLAYLGATAAIIGPAVAISEISSWLTYDRIPAWRIGVPLWLVAVGVPTIGVSVRHLNRTLGVRPTPQLQADGVRSIPVMGDVARLLGRGSQREPGGAIQVAERIVITCGSYVFTEDDLELVLRKAWIRQRGGQQALSRRFWLGREPFYGDREKYDAFADSLARYGVLVGRGDRASGRLITPPLTAIYNLRYRVR